MMGTFFTSHIIGHLLKLELIYINGKAVVCRYQVLEVTRSIGLLSLTSHTTSGSKLLKMTEPVNIYCCRKRSELI